MDLWENARPMTPAAVLDRAARRSASATVVAVLPVWAVWAGAVTLLALLAPVVVPVDEALLGGVEPDGVVLQWWDYTWYADIARYGYPDAFVDAPEGWRYAFFPLFPGILALGGTILPMAVVGGAVAATASLAAFVAVALLDPDGDPRRAAVGLACIPGSFSLLMFYPDGLSLAAAAGACLALRGGRPLVAGVLGVVCATARPEGFLIALPLAALAWRRGGRAARVAAIAPVVGAGLVFVGFWLRSGTPFAFTRAQAHWDRSGPEGLWVTIDALLGGSQLKSAVDVGIAALGVALCVALWRRGVAFRAWALYAGALVGLSLLSGSFGAMGRHVATAFPLAWAFASTPARVRRPLLVAGAVTNAVLTLALVRYYP